MVAIHRDFCYRDITCRNGHRLQARRGEKEKTTKKGDEQGYEQTNEIHVEELSIQIVIHFSSEMLKYSIDR